MAATPVALAAELTPEKLRESMRDQRAISHAVEQVGEAASRLSPEFRDAHPEVPWRRIIGVRNRLAHDYAERIGRSSG
ncbi:MAG TPA: HepT-like ribonuclease domain-containing protein [Longimicrobium sp.]|nr:HepT-like ribonuclease domain-containing protein [Longimicrobium sp.]